jgi:NAD(P)H dehydrogenase (quinone)
MILVTGATGHLGRATVEFLLDKVPAAEIAVLARDLQKASDLKALGVDVRIGDYSDYDSLVKAFHGVDKLLLVSGNDIANRAAQHESVVKAAKEAGVKHLVYTSVDNTRPAQSVISFVEDSHLATAKAVKESGLSWTMLNNNLYADVLPVFLGDKVLEQGVFFPAGNGKVPFATRRDMAEAAANVLSGEGHEGKEYAIAGETQIGFGDVAEILSRLSGRQLSYAAPDVKTYVETLSAAGVPAEFTGFSSAFAGAIAAGEFETTKSDLPALLGRKPATVEEFLKETYKLG